jgi:DNA-binding winged helix-turn-helix (wHTH) protein/TolB-like protein
MDAPIEFGPFRYDPAQRVLFRGADLVPLPPKALDTLHVLLENRGRIVDKAELLRRVWPDTTVEEIGLARNISILRKALGDDFDSYIETIPKRGYRVNPPTDPPTPPPAARSRLRFLLPAAALLVAALVYWQFYRPSPFLPGSAGRAALAILPFDSAPSDREFSAALNETLAARVANLPTVQLTSPSTVRRYRAVHIPPHLMARILGLHVLLEGTVQRDASSIRITARLADVHSGKLIWAESYNHPVSNPTSDTLDTAATAIAAQIGAHLAIRQ